MLPLCYQLRSEKKKSAPPPSTSTHRPCHGSSDQGKLLLALVGPESHDFNSQVVMGVTSGKQKRTFDAVADSGVLPATERGSTRPEPRPPWSLPLPPSTPPSLVAPGAALNTTTELPLCTVTKHLRCYKKKCFFWEKNCNYNYYFVQYCSFPNPLLKKLACVPALRY